MTDSATDPPDQATVAAYLRDELPEPEAEAFEVYCLEHPEFAHKVELDLTLRHALRRVQQTELKGRPFLRWRPLWAMAAGLGAVVAVGVVLLVSSRLHTGLIAFRSPSEIPAKLRAGDQFGVTLVRVRGSAPTREIVVSGRSGVLTLKLFPDTHPGAEGYSAKVVLDAGSGSAVLDHLQTDGDGFLDVYLRLSDVTGHTLNVTVTSNPEDPLSTPAFRLRVVAATE